jgi:hypothetical protein
MPSLNIGTGFKGPEPTPEDRKNRNETRIQNRLKWAKSALKLEPAVRSVDSGKGRMDANFFELKLDVTKDIRKYRINLGLVKLRERSIEPMKRDLRRALIEDLLRQNSPVSPYDTDYFDTIISVGKLYADCDEDNGNPKLERTHTRTVAANDNDPGVVTTEIVYEVRVNLTRLDKMVKGESDADPDYLPDEYLRALNILSWKGINNNDPRWRGGRVQNKFYPSFGKVSEYQKNYPKYWIRTGFFSSMCPDKGSLLLNVNATTSAFYLAISLQAYMENRGFRSFPLSEKFMLELKGLKVMFAGDNDTPKEGKKRTVWNIDLEEDVLTKRS